MGVFNKLPDNLKNAARDLRKNQTDAEAKLWRHLRSKQFEGLRFRRQHPIGSYVVDFICLDKSLVIEVDGGQHDSQRDKDKARDEWLRGEGFKVFRFWNNEVLRNIQGVLEEIRKELY